MSTTTQTPRYGVFCHLDECGPLDVSLSPAPYPNVSKSNVCLTKGDLHLWLDWDQARSLFNRLAVLLAVHDESGAAALADQPPAELLQQG